MQQQQQPQMMGYGRDHRLLQQPQRMLQQSLTPKGPCCGSGGAHKLLLVPPRTRLLQQSQRMLRVGVGVTSCCGTNNGRQREYLLEAGRLVPARTTTYMGLI